MAALNAFGDIYFACNLGVGLQASKARLHLVNPAFPDSNNICIEAGSASDNSGIGLSSIIFNGYNSNGMQRIGAGKSVFRMSVNQQTTGDYMQFDQLDTSGAYKYYLTMNNGMTQVGAGAMPSYTLDVTGTTRVTRQLLLGNSTDTSSTPTRMISALSNLAAGGSTLFAVGAANSSGNQAELVFSYSNAGQNSNMLTLGLFSKVCMGLKFTGETYIPSNLGIGGITVPSYTLDVNGQGQFVAASVSNGIISRRSDVTTILGNVAGGANYGCLNTFAGGGAASVGTTNYPLCIQTQGGQLIIGSSNTSGGANVQVMNTFSVASNVTLQNTASVAARLTLGIGTSNTGVGFSALQAGMYYADVNQSNFINTTNAKGIGSVQAALRLRCGNNFDQGLVYENTANSVLFGIQSSTGNVYMTGNLGIGNTSNNAPLQFANVAANRKIALYDGNNNDHQFTGFGVNNGILRYQVDASTTSHVFYTGASTTASTELMRIAGTGNVGIGTASPNAPLQFANTSVNRKVVLYDATNNDHQFYGLGINNGVLRYQVDSNASSHVFYAGTSTTTSTELMRITGTGNVGVGTSAPAYSLDVNGMAQVRSNLIVNTTRVDAAYGGVFLGTSNLWGTSYFPTIASSGSTSMIVATNLHCAYRSDNAFTGRTGRAGMRCATSAAAVTYWDCGATNVGFEIQNSAVGSTPVVCCSNTNVGIGTSNPQYALDLAGTMRVSSNATFSCNVGIGTSAPIAPLDVSGRIHCADRSNGLSIYQYNAAWDHLRMWVDGSNSYIDAGGAESGLRFRTAAGNAGYPAASYTDMMLITPSNVGVGTLNPMDEMHVYGGSLRVHFNTSTSNTGPCINLVNKIGGGGGVPLRSNTMMALNFITSTEYDGVDTSNDNLMCSIKYILDTGVHWPTYQGRNTGRLGFFTSPDGGVLERMTISRTGNVGIGASNPSALLHLAYNNTLSNNIIFEAGTTSDGGNPGFSAINFNGYYNGGEQRTNTSKTRWRIIANQNSTTDAFVIDQYDGSTFNHYMYCSGGTFGVGTSSPAVFGAQFEDRSVFIGDSAYTTTTIPTSSAVSSLGTANGHRLVFDNTYNGTPGSGMAANKIVLHNNNWISGFGIENNAVTYHSGSKHNFYYGTCNATPYGTLGMVVDSNVGIGTGTPAYKLDVTGTARVSSTATFSANVGIGTTAPNGSLQFANTVASRKIVFWETANNDHQFYGLGINGGILRYQVDVGAAHAFFACTSSTASSELMRITGAGKVGIGSSNPDVTLTMRGASGAVTTAPSTRYYLDNHPYPAMETYVAQHGNVPMLSTGMFWNGTNWMASSNGVSSFQVYNHQNQLRFNYNLPATSNTAITPSTAIAINSNGFVGIGTTTANAPLQFANTIVNRKVVLWDGTNNDHQFYGFGINSGVLRYQVDSTASAHVFYAGTSTTASSELMRITGTGNLGIGTSAPSFGAQFEDRSVFIGDSAYVSTTIPSSAIVATLGTANGHRLVFDNTFNGTSGTGMAANKIVLHNNNGWLAGFGLEINGVTYHSGGGHRLYHGVLNNYGTLGMVVDSNVGIGTGTPTYKLHLSVDSAGKPGTNVWTITSDERIKTDIVDANLDTCYDIVKNLPLKYFRWRDDVYTEEQVPDRHKMGWIAQAVETVFPKAVSTVPEAYGLSNVKNLNTDQIYAAMYGALQSLQVKHETLKSEHETLKSNYTALLDRIVALESRSP